MHLFQSTNSTKIGLQSHGYPRRPRTGLAFFVLKQTLRGPGQELEYRLAECDASAKNLRMNEKAHMRGFAICTAPRSGSNFLSQLLSSTGQLGRPLEYFNGPGRRYFDDPRYPDDRSAQIEKILTMGATSNGIYGLKIFAHQHDWIEGEVKWAALLPGLQFIFLRRRDILGQAISWVRALQTGQYRHGQASIGDAAFDGQAILDRLRAIATEYARWEMYFARNEIATLRFYYEDVVDAPQQAVDSVAGLFNLHLACADARQISVIVQRDETTENWRKRFVEDFGDPNSVDRL